MTACQLASGKGCGWPLNAFALPDGRPVWAGTYFPQEQWLKVLDQFKTLWTQDRDKLKGYAESLTSGIQQRDEIITGAPQEFQPEVATEMAEALLSQVDMKLGGRQGAPKFPMPSNYLYLLNYHVMTGDVRSLTAVNKTLEHMARGGIYDQIGGGFARYSTDAQWFAPHFEKMLYDNSQLVSLYSKAWQVTQNPLYRAIVEQTIDWISREMTNDLGGFYSSLDADSEGEEGKFYVWSASEIEAVLPPDVSIVVKDYYTVSDRGNWEETNILHRDQNSADIAKKHNLTEIELEEIISKALPILLAERETRDRPGLDDKILTSWNALMITGLLNSYQAFGNSEYLRSALDNAKFIKDNMLQSDYRLMRNYKDGGVKINAFLDDYAFLIEAFVNLYQVTFDESWLYDAKRLAEYTLNHFFDPTSGLFHYTSDIDPPLIARKKELGDNVIPGSNSAMARNLHALGQYYPESEFQAISDSMIYQMIDPIVESQQTSFYSNWALLYLEKMNPTFEVAIIGSDYSTLLAHMQKSFIPNALYLGGETEGTLDLLKDKLLPGDTRIYVCQNKVCQLPVSDAGKALSQMQYH
ncbi:UNVERIFIED_CONTAM: hypothetical protein GTU68_031835 [Idotea baltica]|nr:hypothetical protein [Idotea baltica]